MPFTFLAHQAPVLPLALVWPRRFDALALCIGSMAPDFAYVAAGTRLAFATHNTWGLAWFCLPVTLVATLLIRRTAPTLVTQLPLPLALRRGATNLLGPAPPLLRTITSAALGAATHIVLDAFTHRRGFGVAWFPALETSPFTLLGRPVPYYSLLQGPGSLVLAALALRALARRSPTNPPLPVPTPAARRRFTRIAVPGLLLSIALTLAMAPLGGIPAAILRLTTFVFLTLTLAALLTESPQLRPDH